MAEFKPSDNSTLYDILSNAQVTSSNIESFDNNVYIVSLDSPTVLNSFLLKLDIGKEDYDYGIAYVDILSEKDQEFNRDFNCYAFYFEKSDDNTITQIIDVNEPINIKFLQHPAFQTNRLQPTGNLRKDNGVYVPVFPEQDQVVKEGAYLPLFPLNMTKLTFSDMEETPDNDIYEIRSEDSKSYLSISNRYNVFNNATNIDLFGKSLLSNFYVDPNGIVGKSIQDALPYVTVIPNTLPVSPSQEVLLSPGSEIASLANTGAYTVSSKSYEGDTPVLQYCRLRNKNIRETGGIEGQYIKISIEFFSYEPKDETEPSFSGEDPNNPASSLYLDMAIQPIQNAHYLEINNIDGQNRPVKVTLWSKDKTCDNNSASFFGLTLNPTTHLTSEITPTINFIEKADLSSPTPKHISRKIASDSKIGLTLLEYMDNYYPSAITVTSSNVSEMSVVDYRYVNTCEDNTEITAYTKGFNVPANFTISDGKYIVFTCVIVWA